jgi:uncharacterized protein (TIGR03083 family)
MDIGIDFDAALEGESLRFAAALQSADGTAPVPTCPDWRAEDLLWHLGKVQHFWATIVHEGFTDEAQVRSISPERPDNREGLLDFFHGARTSLCAGLRAVDDATPVWTWSADQTVGFVRRRQAHEALIHRLDAELTAGVRTPLDPALSSDGVDEALRVMYGGHPDWGAFTPDGRTVRLDATDTGRTWVVGLGRFAGEDPEDGPVDEPDIAVLDDATSQPLAHVAATAADLDCWLWHRPVIGPVDRSGDADTMRAFAAIVSAEID